MSIETTELIEAVRKGDIAFCSQLLALESKDISYHDLACEAIRRKMNNVARLIMDKYNFDPKTQEGTDLLIDAFTRDNNEMTLYLLERGAKIDAKLFDSQLNNILHLLINENKPVLLAKVLEDDCGLEYIKYENLQKETPIDLACKQNSIEMLRILLASGISMDYCDLLSKKNAIDVCCHRGKFKCSKILG